MQNITRHGTLKILQLKKAEGEGVAIGLGREVTFSLEDRKVDPEGRFIFLRGKLEYTEYTLANIYCPKKNPTSCLKYVLGKLMDYKKVLLILAADLNFCTSVWTQRSIVCHKHRRLETINSR